MQKLLSCNQQIPYGPINLSYLILSYDDDDDDDDNNNDDEEKDDNDDDNNNNYIKTPKEQYYSVNL